MTSTDDPTPIQQFQDELQAEVVRLTGRKSHWRGLIEEAIEGFMAAAIRCEVDNYYTPERMSADIVGGPQKDLARHIRNVLGLHTSYAVDYNGDPREPGDGGYVFLDSRIVVPMRSVPLASGVRHPRTATTANPGTRRCPHGYHHPGHAYSIPHSCDGCWCEGEHDRERYGWVHDTKPGIAQIPITSYAGDITNEREMK